MPIFIGWDVGGWNCDKNPASRDALVVLDKQCRILGAPWRGNLRKVINQANDSVDFIARLLALCGLEDHEYFQVPVVLAIDTPLGFSVALRELFAGKPSGPIGNSSSNPYLFRYTERLLFERGLSPLSAIKDMIGSQATKGMHVVARFAPVIERCGVWTDTLRLRVIETYPAACKHSPAMAALRAVSATDTGLGHADQDDALICALLAWLFHCQPEQLVQPDPSVDLGEGWIFVLADGLAPAG
ncbi:hypothetical protein ACLEJW_20120 [Pseudomonas sp. SMSB3]|uniref:hypothetical protein n=1 Tax=Pseudomonas sp. SMSB3 TaxID=3390196 RepID=UPI003F833A62